MPENGQSIAASEPRNSVSAESVVVERLPFDRPWEWLAAGWRDLWNAPLLSFAYGALPAILGVAIAAALAMHDLGAMVPVLAGGFMLVGPLMAVGLYEKSRLIANGETPTFAATLVKARSSALRLGLLTALLLFLYLVWLRIAFMLLALFLGTRGLPPAQEFMPTLLFTPHGLGLLVVGTAVGGLLAVIGFATTAISIPMVMDRRIDAVSAILKSIEAVVTNIRPMALWAALIAGFTALGLATAGLGLVVLFPLIGHATWHAYKDTIRSGTS